MANVDIVIVPGGHREFETCHRLAEQCPPLVAHETFAYWTFLLGFPNGTLLARVDGKDVGFVCSFQTQNKSIGRMVWQIGVLERYRRLGIAWRLLSAIRSHFPEEPLISASIDPENKPSMRLFSSFATQFCGVMHRNKDYADSLINTPVADYGEELFSLEFEKC